MFGVMINVPDKTLAIICALTLKNLGDAWNGIFIMRDMYWNMCGCISGSARLVCRMFANRMLPGYFGRGIHRLSRSLV